jgi:ESCRT-II complex subunit VPS25
LLSQPNATTWSTQQNAWSALILAYCERHRLFKFSVGHELFTNTELSRRLPTPAAIEVMEAMVKQGKAEWIGPEKQEILVYWKTPRDWANAVYDWVCWLKLWCVERAGSRAMRAEGE